MSQFDPRSTAHQSILFAISTALGLALLAVCVASDAHSSEKDPNAYTLDQITAAVCAVETGTIYVSRGVVSGGWGMGAAGETGPWQVTPMVLQDLGLDSGQDRCVDWHERAFRKWYARLLAKTRSHDKALAAYHRGLGGMSRLDAKDYAQRVLNYAGTL